MVQALCEAMMSIMLGCIADDYTGATDLANTLTQNGLRAVQLQGVPPAPLDWPEADAVVIALKSRSIAADEAVALSVTADEWLRDQGARHIMFKVCSTFDSTDRGNIGPVISALRARHGGALMPVSPAFPALGRTVYGGHLFVDGVLLSESPLRDHPLNPMRDSDLVRLLSRQTEERIALASYATVDAGPAVLGKALRSLAAEGAAAVIVDSLCERHLVSLGAAALEGPISSGASGLGLGLARQLAQQRLPDAEGRHARAAEGAAVAMIAGSCSRTTLDQVAEAERIYPLLRLCSNEVLGDPEQAVADALGWAEVHLRAQRPFLIATSAERSAVEGTQSRYGLETTARTIEDALATLGEALVRQGVSKLVVAGGETSGAVVGRLGILGFAIGSEVAPGVPVVHALGTDQPMSLVLKSGNFGDRTFFVDAVEAMGA